MGISFVSIGKTFLHRCTRNTSRMSAGKLLFSDQVANTRNAPLSFEVSEEGWEKSGLSRFL